MSGFVDFLEGNAEAAVGAFTGQPTLVAAGAAKSGGALLSAGNSKDAQRAAAAQQALGRAAGGDLSQALWILQERDHSATAYGKQQYAAAFEALKTQNPAIAAQALQQYQNVDPVNTDSSVKSKLAAEWDSLVKKIKQDVGTTVQNVGSGVTTSAATAIDPNTGRVTLPLSSSMLWTVAIVVLAIGAAFLLTRKHNA